MGSGGQDALSRVDTDAGARSQPLNQTMALTEGRPGSDPLASMLPGVSAAPLQREGLSLSMVMQKRWRGGAQGAGLPELRAG